MTPESTPNLPDFHKQVWVPIDGKIQKAYESILTEDRSKNCEDRLSFASRLALNDLAVLDGYNSTRFMFKCKPRLWKLTAGEVARELIKSIQNHYGIEPDPFNNNL